MSNSPYIIIVNAQNFKTEVLEKSKELPVLVDFWAEWCSPCKMLMPVLEKLVESYQGGFILAKVNTEQEKQLAAQYGIRSIPALKLFRYGQIVEDVVGVQQENMLRELIDRHRDHPADQLRLEAIQAHTLGNSEQAIALLREGCIQEPNYYPVRLELIKLLIDTDQVVEAQDLLQNLPVAMQSEVEVKSLSAYLSFAVIAHEAPELEVLEQQLIDNPSNDTARYQASAHYVLMRNYESAMQHLLELTRRNRQFKEDAGRKGLLTIFTLLENRGALVNQYRAKMSSLLY